MLAARQMQLVMKMKVFALIVASFGSILIAVSLLYIINLTVDYDVCILFL